VLIDLGANWCADCRILQALMDRPEIHDFLAPNYVVVVVDVGRLNRNLQVPARFGITDRLEGVPAILIADSDGKLVNAGHIFALVETRHMTPQEIADWLARWTR
jgi:thiol:disulfide interchange protein